MTFTKDCGSEVGSPLPLTLATLRVLPQTADERTFATPLAEVVETAFVSDGNRAA
jgi:chemotaxis protein histidine kinase CheA